MCNSAYSHASSIMYDKIVLIILKNERNLTFGKSEKKINLWFYLKKIKK